MNFKVESVVGCRKLWVVVYNSEGVPVDAMPVLRFTLGLERRIKRKIRRMLRVHNKLVALGFRK